MTKKILIATGGTGGHIYPAEALESHLLKEYPEAQILYAGGDLEHNSFFLALQRPFKSTPCANFNRGKHLQNLLALCIIFFAIFKSLWILLSYRPHAVVGFGSYHTFPILFASVLLRKPIVLYEANAIPGRVNKLFAPHAEVVALHLPEAAQYLKGRNLTVGMLLRDGYSYKSSSQIKGRQYFNLDPHLFTFLIIGGSQGATSLNFLVTNALTEYLSTRTKNFQVLHIAGTDEAAALCQKAYDEAGITAIVKGFEPRLDLAYRAADLAISRAGAAAIAEMIEMELPMILVPYPYAKDQHQLANANFVAYTINAAVLFSETTDHDKTSSTLAQEISDLAADERSKLNRLQQNIREYKKHQLVKRTLVDLVATAAQLRLR
jgi:UDP-N-acetylglucosamine--N-acetylmuramyl-(pentapeptide) pyrophosphoryl-undecaprenol N-acetylglucosamine transferase